MKKVEFKIEAQEYVPGQMTDREKEIQVAKEEARELKKKDVYKKINKAINNQYAVCLQQHKLL